MARVSQWLPQLSEFSDWRAIHQSEARVMTSLEYQYRHLTAHPLPMGVVGMSVVGFQQLCPTAIGNRFVGNLDALPDGYLAQETNLAILDEDTGEELGLE